MRDAIENVIKDCGINRKRASEVSKNAYASIIKNIENKFVLHGGSLHWSNMGEGFRSHIPCATKSIDDNPLWYRQIKKIVPQPEDKVYVLFEGTKDFQPKYWVYEMYLDELIVILDELVGVGDFYIVSKKYEWLITECHEDVVSFVGESIFQCKIEKY